MHCLKVEMLFNEFVDSLGPGVNKGQIKLRVCLRVCVCVRELGREGCGTRDEIIPMKE